MEKIKILFFIFDLGGGGAEKVLVNLVNNLNPDKYDITVRTLFGGGKNVAFLNSNIHYSSFFRRRPFGGTSFIQKFLSPRLLYKILIKGNYEIEIAFLFNISTRVIAGSSLNSKKFAWIHSVLDNYRSFKNKEEMINIYKSFDGTAFVSRFAYQRFLKDYGFDPNGNVIYNVNETEKIKALAKEDIILPNFDIHKINLVSVGRLSWEKGYERLIRTLGKLYKEGIQNWHFYLLGEGKDKEKLVSLCQKMGLIPEFIDSKGFYNSYKKSSQQNQTLTTHITFLGFQDNPYKYLSKMDLFICPSFIEGYSTAATESIIVGTPLLTTECSGMSEIIGGSEAGVIVPNNEESLFEGLKPLLLNPSRILGMKKEAIKRSSAFSTKKAIENFEKFIGTFNS